MIQIGNLQIDLEQREIRHAGTTLRVGSRALDILELLIRAEGGLVTKSEIMSRVWPTSFVEENNLQVHVAALRKALGDDRDLIRTVPGRGYQLVASKTSMVDTGQIVPHCVKPGVLASVPASVHELVGREGTLYEVVSLLDEVPELTLVGAGGIGKTSLAIHLAHEIGAQFHDGVRFLELAALSEANAVMAAVVRACELPYEGSELSARQIAEALTDQQCLIVLDNAEHVIDVVAELVDALVALAPQVRTVVTSREPLRLESETLLRVPPLDVPPPDAPLNEVSSHSAVQLFVRRMRSTNPALAIDPQSLRLIGDICRQLDGIALAIELAAVRATALGVKGVSSRLDDRFQLLTGGHRNALPRHQTLRATFDWSYGLLDPLSRKIFRRLGVFVGVFRFESVCAVAADADIPLGHVIASVGDLVGKSLLNVEFEGCVALYRLSESTRAYAMDKLRDEGECREIARRYLRLAQQCSEARSDHSDQQWSAMDVHAFYRRIDELMLER